MAKSYLTPKENWENMKTQTGMLSQPQQQTQNVDASTEALYSQAKQQEAGFVSTAPKGYFEDKLTDINI